MGEREQVLKEKVAAVAFAKNYMSGIESSVLDRLSKMAYFYDPVEREVETDFMPWLGGLAMEKLSKAEVVQSLASEWWMQPSRRVRSIMMHIWWLWRRQLQGMQ